MHDDLVEEVGSEALPGDVRAEDDHVAALGCTFRNGHRFVDPNVDESTRHPLHNGRRRRWLMAQYEERTTKGTAVEPGMQPVFNILRSSADKQRAGRSEHLGNRLASAAIDAEETLHVVVRTGDESVQAHHRVP